MLSLVDVRRWDADALERVVAALGAAHDQLDGIDDTLRTARPAPEAWQGVAAEAARSAHDATTAGLRRLSDGLGAARPAVADAADAITALRADLAYAEALAAAGGFAIAADATVTDVRPTVVPADEVDAYRSARAGAQAQIVEVLGQVLGRATTVDAALRDALVGALVGALARITAEHTAPAGAGRDPGVVPTSATPDQVAAWWRGLSPDQRERLLATDADQLGNLDGLPGAARDAANRARLPAQLTRVESALGAAEAALADAHARAVLRRTGRAGPATTPEEARLGGAVIRLRRQRDALVAIRSAVEGPHRQLLLLDVDGHVSPRAAVAVGDVDTADHVAVFTPGFSTTVAGGLAPTVNDLAALRQTAGRRLAQVPGRAGQSVATVAWIGYDVPQWDTVIDPGRSVLSDAAARRGGADLARFDDGLLAARGDRRPHFTALGHSYGSTTTGYALMQTTRGVDDAVLFGSPGLGTGNPADLHVPPGHLDVIAAPGDPVAASGVYGGRPSSLPGVVDRPAWPATTGDGTPLAGSFGHSAYLVPGTTSQYEIAATVAGLPDARVRPHLPPTGPRLQ